MRRSPHLSHSLVDHWGATDDLATSSLHSSRLSAFLMAAPSVMAVHSRMLFSHLFFCLPRLRPPCNVPCRIVLASPVDLVTYPYHFSLRRFTVVKRSSWGLLACQVLFCTTSYWPVTLSLYCSDQPQWQQIQKDAEHWKEKGNHAVKQENYIAALECYQVRAPGETLHFLM